MDLDKELYVLMGGVLPYVEECLVDLVGGHGLRAIRDGFSKCTVIVPSSEEMSATTV
jgi:hypothetical protein